MIADIKLNGIRELIRQIRNADQLGGALGRGLKADRAIELANVVQELDEWLNTGGMFPLAWLPPQAGGTGKSA